MRALSSCIARLLADLKTSTLLVTTGALAVLPDMLNLLFEALLRCDTSFFELAIMFGIGLKILAEKLMSPFLLNLTIWYLMQAVDHCLDKLEAQASIANEVLNALLEDEVAVLALHDHMQLAVVNELLDNLVLQLIVGLLDGVLNQVRRVLVHRQTSQVAEQVVVDRQRHLVRIVREHMEQDIVGELVLSVRQHVSLDLIQDSHHVRMIVQAELDDFFHDTKTVLVASQRSEVPQNVVKQLLANAARVLLS